MDKDKALTGDNFNQLLNWLNADREAAGEVYEKIRAKLIKIFRYRGSLIPEELADRTIDRVSRRVGHIAEEYRGDPETYFYGVANKIHLESLRKPAREWPSPPPADDPPDDRELRLRCLDRCLGKLSAENRGLILRYYQGEKGDKIEHRKDLSESAGVRAGTFRTRLYRTRVALKHCVKDCLQAAQV